MRIPDEKRAAIMKELAWGRYYRRNEIAKRHGICPATITRIERASNGEHPTGASRKRAPRPIEAEPPAMPVRQYRRDGEAAELPQRSWLMGVR